MSGDKNRVRFIFENDQDNKVHYYKVNTNDRALYFRFIRQSKKNACKI